MAQQPPRELRFPTARQPIPAPDGWGAERHQGGGPGKAYVCPGCSRDVAAGSDHVRAWLSDEPTKYRHWHSNCWAVAKREGLDRYRHW